METAPVVTRDLHLEKLRSFHDSLVAALGETGCGGQQLAVVLGRHVQAECLQCGIAVTGEEIADALSADAAHSPANPRHARLLRHYCARSGCPSYFYRFAFHPFPDLDWETCLARAAQIESGVQRSVATEKSGHQAARDTLKRRQLLKAGAVLGGIAGFWALRHWWVTGSLPGVAPTPKYQIDPRTAPRERPTPPRP